MSEAQAGRMGAQPVAVAKANRNGKRYRELIDEDMAAFRQAEQCLNTVINCYDPFSGELPAIPDEPLPPKGTLGFRIQRYGLQSWGEVFNARQLVTLTTFQRFVREAHHILLQEANDPEYAKVVATYLAIAVDRLADASSTLVRWTPTAEVHANTFARQALPMLWDYVETNPFGGGSGDWQGCLEWISKYVRHGAATASTPADVRRGTANQLPFDSRYFDAVITDPPYPLKKSGGRYTEVTESGPDGACVCWMMWI